MIHHTGLSPAAPGAAREGDAASSGKLRIDVRRLSWFRRISTDYAFDFGQLAEFYAGNPADAAAWADTIARVRQHPHPRAAVADVIDGQHRRRGAPAEAVRSAALLREPGTVAVVTGQQAGLFGGPLYTLLKALTAIRLAERLEVEHQVRAVPVFWIEAEDHDWDEVKSCTVLNPDLQVCTAELGNPPGANEGAVARVHLDRSVLAALDTLEHQLPRTEFTDHLLAGLRQAYQVDFGMADAFGRWIEQILGPRGLIVYDAADPAAKPLVADLFAREIEHGGVTSRLASEAGAKLAARGYHAQVTPNDGFLALFHLNAGRETIRLQGDSFAIGDRVCTRQQLLDELRRTPEQFSPSVLLRPLVQDTLFPTVCYVAGPSELAYWGQLAGIYREFGVPMPLVQQRLTATLVDANAMRFLHRHELPLESLRPQDEALLNELLESQLPPSVEASLQDVMRAVEERMAALAGEVPQIDATLEGATRSTLTRMQDDLKKLHNKIIQAAKRKDETLRRQFKHAQAQSFPAGDPQERAIGLVYFLNKYGPALVDRLVEELPLDQGVHWVLTV